jgi:serine/threonine protein kinase
MSAFEQFGPFTLLEKLAEGGMAFTWLARMKNEEPGAEFVVKRILPRLAEDPELRALFLDEARVALRLSHPNVVKTFGFGDVDGEYWLAMEHIWGQDLRRAMERAQGVGKALPLKMAVDIVARTARGLHHAHDLLDEKGRPIGLVHRDVSPPNLLLGFDGSVKLVDFGIARSESRWLQAREGQLKGKFSYMSPEQVQGLEIDHRSDIFSLGIILYELTTKTRLFKADSDVMTIKLVSEARFDPPNRLRADFPPRLSEIIVRALAADPRDRYDSARDLADALDLFLKETRQESTPAQLAAWMGDIFPDRIEDLNELTGRDYTGATRRPVLPEPPKPAPVAKPVAPIDLSAAPDLEIPVRPAAPAPRIAQDLIDSGNDEFVKQQRGGNMLLAGFALVAVVVLGYVAYIAMGQGVRTTYLDDIDVGIARGDFDAEVAPPPPPPPMADVQVTSEPPGAWIIVNGNATRQRTPASVALVAGAHNTIALHLDGHKTQYVQVAEVAATGNAPIAATLEAYVQPADWTPPPPATPGEPPATWAPPRGRVRVEARTPAGPLEGAEVLRNGERVNGGTPVEIDIPAGEDQHITVRVAGHRDAVTVVRAMPWDDETDTRVISLELPAARENAAELTTLRLTTTPRGATVRINGEELGAVNLRNLPSPMQYLVEIDAPDHEPFVRAIQAVPGQFDLNALLTPIRTGPSIITINAEPEGVQIFAQAMRHGAPGATQIGTTAVAARSFDAGRYQITLFSTGAEGRQRGRAEFELLPDTHHTFALRLENAEIVVVSETTEPIPVATP